MLIFYPLKVKVTQLFSTLCDLLVDYTVHGILQARILQWVAFLFFRGPAFDPWDKKIPLEKGMATHSSILAGEFHG